MIQNSTANTCSYGYEYDATQGICKACDAGKVRDQAMIDIGIQQCMYCHDRTDEFVAEGHLPAGYYARPVYTEEELDLAGGTVNQVYTCQWCDGYIAQEDGLSCSQKKIREPVVETILDGNELWYCDVTRADEGNTYNTMVSKQYNFDINDAHNIAKYKKPDFEWDKYGPTENSVRNVLSEADPPRDAEENDFVGIVTESEPSMYNIQFSWTNNRKCVVSEPSKTDLDQHARILSHADVLTNKDSSYEGGLSCEFVWTSESMEIMIEPATVANQMMEEQDPESASTHLVDVQRPGIYQRDGFIGDKIEIIVDHGGGQISNTVRGGYGKVFNSGETTCRDLRFGAKIQGTSYCDPRNAWLDNKHYSDVQKLTIKFTTSDEDVELTYRKGFNFAVRPTRNEKPATGEFPAFKLIDFNYPTHKSPFNQGPTALTRICNYMNADRKLVQKTTYHEPTMENHENEREEIQESFNMDVDAKHQFHHFRNHQGDSLSEKNTNHFRAVRQWYTRTVGQTTTVYDDLFTEVWCTQCVCKQNFRRPGTAKTLKQIIDKLNDDGDGYNDPDHADHFWNSNFDGTKYGDPADEATLGSETKQLRYWRTLMLQRLDDKAESTWHKSAYPHRDLLVNTEKKDGDVSADYQYFTNDIRESLGACVDCSSCTTCSANQKIASRKSECEAQPGETCVTACEHCEEGTQPNAQQTLCEPCPPGTMTPSAGMLCVKCSEQDDLTIDPEGYYASDPSNCQWCEGFKANDAGTGCNRDECAKGFMFRGTQCRACPAGSYYNTDTTMCTLCEVGKYQDATGEISELQCKKCKDDELSPGIVGATRCDRCEAAKFMFSDERIDDGDTRTTECRDCTDDNGVTCCACCPAGEEMDPAQTGTCTSAQCASTGYEDKNICIPCQQGKFSRGLSAHGCDVCPPGQTLLNPAIANDEAICVDCEAGKFANGYDMTSCELCAPGFVSEAGAADCDLCPSGKYMDTYTANTDLKLRKVTNCKRECPECPDHQYMHNCVGDYPASVDPRDPHLANPAKCKDCDTCKEGFRRVGCIHSEGHNDASGHCIDETLVVQTPQCAEKIPTSSNVQVAYELAPDLGGWSYQQVFGLSHENIADFQCRETCIGRTVDTSYCAGPFACNKAACSMGVERDGDVLYQVARACPVLLPDLSFVNKLMSDFTQTQQDRLRQVRRTACQTCAECGSNAPLDAVDWGLGCAGECSQLQCDEGQIFDFTASSLGKCTTCDELTDIRLCTQSQQTALSLNTDGVSGLGALLKWPDCQPLTSQPLKTSNNILRPQYGECSRCTDIPQCQSDEYPKSCAACGKCLQRGNLFATTGKYLDTSFEQHNAYCQMKQCEGDKTGVLNSGIPCSRDCSPAVCTEQEFSFACRLPHDTRCIPLRPRSFVSTVLHGVVPAHANMLEYTQDNTQTAPEMASSFENVAVNLRGLDHEKHQCVWDSLGIVDNRLLPGGISHAFFSRAATRDSAYLDVGTKHCRPIDTSTTSILARDGFDFMWDRDPRKALPLAPLQNTITSNDEATAATPRRALINTSASVVAYESKFTLPVETAELVVARPQTYVGDLYLQLNMAQARSAVVMFPLSSERIQTESWVQHWAVSTVLVENTLGARDSLHPLQFKFGFTQNDKWWYFRRQSDVEECNADPSPCSMETTFFALQHGMDIEPKLSSTLRTYYLLHAGGIVVQIQINEPEGHHDVQCYSATPAAVIPSASGRTMTSFQDSIARGCMCVGDDEQIIDLQIQFHVFKSSTKMPVVAARQGLINLQNVMVLATPRRFEVFERFTGTQYLIDFQLNILILDVALSQDLVFVLKRQRSQDASTVETVVSMYECDSPTRTCTHQGPLEDDTLDTKTILAFDAAFDGTNTVMHALRMKQTEGQVTMFRDTWHVVHTDQSQYETRSGTETMIDSNVMFQKVGLYTTAASAQPNGVLFVYMTWLEDKLTCKMHVHLDAFSGTYDLTSLGENAVYGDIVDISKFNAFAQSTQSGDAEMGMQCRPSLAWIAADSFVLSWSCIGKVYRGIITKGSTIEMLEVQESRLQNTLFFYNTVVDGLDNAAIVLTNGAEQVSPMSPESMQATVLQSECALGFERAQVEITQPETLSLRDDTLETCSDACVSRLGCMGYKLSSSQCVIILAIGNYDLKPPEGSATCLRQTLPYVQTSARLLELAGLSAFAATLIPVFDHAVVRAHVKGFRPMPFDTAVLTRAALCTGDPSEALLSAVWAAGTEEQLKQQHIAAGIANGEYAVPVSEATKTNCDENYARYDIASDAVLLFRATQDNVQVSVNYADVTLLVQALRNEYILVRRVQPLSVYIERYDDEAASLELHNDDSVSADVVGMHVKACAGASLVHFEKNPTKSPRAVLIDQIAALTGSISGQVPTGSLQRVTLTVPNPLPVKSFVTLEVSRQPDTHDLIATSRIEESNVWPTRRLTRVQRTVPVDDFSVMPLLSRPPLIKTGDRVYIPVYVPLKSQLEDYDLELAYSDQETESWPRVHALVTAVLPNDATRQCSARLVHIDIDTDKTIIDDNSLIQELSCLLTPNGLGEHDCALQLPSDADNDDDLLGVEILCDDATDVMDVDFYGVRVSVAPMLAMHECRGAEVYLTADGNCADCVEADEAKKEECDFGQRPKFCAAFHQTTLQASDCIACSEVKPDANADWKARGVCEWTCSTGYYRNERDECIACTDETAVTCGQGESWHDCTPNADGACKTCPDLDPAENLRYAEAGTCRTQCEVGYFREAFGDTLVCSPCSTLADIQSTLSLLVNRDNYYRFQECTAISDLTAVACVDPTSTDPSSFVYVGDALAVHTTDNPSTCQFACPNGYESSVVSAATATTITPSITLTGNEFESATVDIYEPEASCVACATLGTVTYQPFYKDDEGCSVFCPHNTIEWSGFTSPPSNEQICRQCLATDCAVGETIDCGACAQDTTVRDDYNCKDNFCQSCSALTDSNSEYYVAGTCDITRCKTGYFYHHGLNACAEHATQRDDCVSPQYWWEEGDTEFDSACRVCTSCEGRFLTTACTCFVGSSTCSDTVCADCTEPAPVNAHYIGTDCTTTVCDTGYVENKANSECELCDHECAVGETFTPDRESCTDCRDCNTILTNPKPVNAHWRGPAGSCDWSCSVGEGGSGHGGRPALRR